MAIYNDIIYFKMEEGRRARFNRVVEPLWWKCSDLYNVYNDLYFIINPCIIFIIVIILLIHFNILIDTS